MRLKFARDIIDTLRSRWLLHTVLSFLAPSEVQGDKRLFAICCLLEVAKACITKYHLIRTHEMKCLSWNSGIPPCVFLSFSSCIGQNQTLLLLPGLLLLSLISAQNFDGQKVQDNQSSSIEPSCVVDKDNEILSPGQDYYIRVGIGQAVLLHGA